jgi:DNA replication initiation complex subunit (GINS family)
VRTTLPDEELDYETISQLFQKERKVSRLTEISAEFYSNINKYIKNLEIEYKKELNKNPTSPTTLLLREEHLKTLKLLKRIYEIRERKVILFALNKVKGSAQNIKNITPQEESLLREIVEVLNRSRTPILHITGHSEVNVENKPSKNIEPEDAPEIIEPEPQKQPESGRPTLKKPDEDGEPDNQESTTGSGAVLALVLEDISSFVGTDLRTYTLQREDVVSLPKDVASILVKNNKVRLLEI